MLNSEYGVCLNYHAKNEIEGLFIGYAKNSFPMFIVIPSLAIITNVFVIFTHWKRSSGTKKNQVSMEKMLLILIIFETLLAFYWLFSGIFFYKAKQLADNCVACFIFSMISIFLHCCDWIFLTFTIHNLFKIITDPIEGVLRNTKRINMYLLITFVTSGAVTLLSYMAKVYGRSPMLTCFIRTEFFETNQYITLVIFLLIPFAFVLCSLYFCFAMCLNKKIHSDKNLASLYYKYISYISVYLIFNAPMIFLYLLTIKEEIIPDTFLSWLSFMSCSMTASISLILTLVRLVQGYVKIDFWELCMKKKTKLKKVNTVNENLLTDGNTIVRVMTKTEEFEWLEKRVLETFMRDLFIGICFFMKHCKAAEETKDPIEKLASQKIFKKDCLNTNEAVIDESNLNFDDEFVQSSGSIDVSFTEYAPKVFHQLRKLENLDENELLESLLPMKNKVSLRESQGKSGNFFICTDDNKFVLKTITPEELELIRGIFLKKCVKHLNRFSNSLVCRIYGLYKMTLANGNEILVILMRNVIGQFKNNALCKYDLKGSSLNRRTDFEIDTVHKIVMKDLNFDEIEKYLVMDKVDIERLRFACMTDAYFLNDMDIMDYSLFVVKLSLNNKEIQEIFGKDRASVSIDSVNGEQNTIFSNVKEIEHYRKYLFRSLNNNIVYIIAIIDYLQHYNFYKYLETNLKCYIHNGPDGIEAISCVPPEKYCTRFIEYVKKITELENQNINKLEA